MNESDPNDRNDQNFDSEPQTDAQSTPSNIIALGINVGVRSLTDFLGGIIDMSTTPGSDVGEWETVDWTASTNRETSSRRSPPELTTEPSVESPDDYLVDTRQTEDEFVVVAELPGVDEEDLSVGIDVNANDLVISVEDRTIDRIPLPWSSSVAAKVWFNNSVLEVHTKPDDEE